MPDDDYDYEVVDESATLSEDLDRKIQQMTRQADEDIAEARVSFRWGKEQLSFVKRVAATMGVPYQTYIKQAVYRQALQDMSMIEGKATVHSVTGTELNEGIA